MTRSSGVPSEPTIRAYQALTALAAPLGLHAQPAKCTVYSENAAAANTIADHLDLQHSSEGLLAAGTPTGTVPSKRLVRMPAPTAPAS
jgi:hypothetical protein